MRQLHRWKNTRKHMYLDRLYSIHTIVIRGLVEPSAAGGDNLKGGVKIEDSQVNECIASAPALLYVRDSTTRDRTITRSSQ